MTVERSLTIEVENYHPIGLLHLGGFMGQLEVYKLKKQIEVLFEESKRYLIFDLSNVTFIDSAGIGVISQIRAECARRVGQLVIVKSMSPQVSQSLQLSGLSRLFDFFDDSRQAVDSLRIKHGLEADETDLDAVTLKTLMALIVKIDERLKDIEARLSVLEQR